MIEVKAYQKPLPKCRSCRDRYTPKYNSQLKHPFCLEKEQCIADWREWMKSQQGSKEVKKVQRKADKEAKKKVERWRNKLQTKLQKIARQIDKGQPCPARGYTNYKADGGHVYAKGGNSSMALNLHAIHRQSAQSNHWQNDDGIFRDGLEKEYGKDYLTFISELRRTPQLKYTNIEYHSFYELACKISNRLAKLDKVYDLEERIELRNQLNIELNIYPREYSEFNNKQKKVA